MSGGGRLFWVGIAAVALGVCVVGFFVVRAAERDFGDRGIWVALIAGGVCFAGTVAALVLSTPTGSTLRDTHRLFGSVAARTGIPIVACLLLTWSSGLPLAAVFGMVLAYYLVALTLETWFAVQIGATRKDGRLSRYVVTRFCTSKTVISLKSPNSSGGLSGMPTGTA